MAFGPVSVSPSSGVYTGQTFAFQFSDFADTIHLYVGQLKTLATEMRDEAKERNKEISEGVYQALYDPTDYRYGQNVVHYIGTGVEWWFNSSYR